jgi:hypothetical protein
VADFIYKNSRSCIKNKQGENVLLKLRVLEPITFRDHLGDFVTWLTSRIEVSKDYGKGRRMRKNRSTDYATYREIMGELVRPIEAEGLDLETLKRLYESKLVYLENLRVHCFYELNSKKGGHYTIADYQLILKAVSETNRHLRELILVAMTTKLKKRSVGAS